MARADILPGWLEDHRGIRPTSGVRLVLHDIKWAFRIYAASKNYKAVLTGSERAALIFAVLQAISPRRCVPHILLQCMWEPPNGRWTFPRRLWLRLVLKGVDRVVVWSKGQPQAYSDQLGVSVQRFVWIPYHEKPAKDVGGEVADPPYIFAGGDSWRDYDTLLRALEGVSMPTLIASVLLSSRQGFTPPGNVSVAAVTSERFDELLAGAAVVVVPMRKALVHSGGHQTYLTAMRLGKAVVVADSCDADEYIENGVEGIVVPAGDADALREALLRLQDDPELRLRLGKKGRERCTSFTLDDHIDRLLDLADELIAESSPRK